MTFFWPQQPNGSVGPGRQSFRTLVAGQVVTNALTGRFYIFTSRNRSSTSPTRREPEISNFNDGRADLPVCLGIEAAQQRRPTVAAMAFTLVEILVVVVLLSLIVLALMAVFNGTQTAFRAEHHPDRRAGGRPQR